MIVTSQGGILCKTGFVWAIAVTLIIVLSVNVQAAPAKSNASTREAKMDAGEWKKVIEAAKREGKIVMCGSPGEGWRKSLADMFQQEYPQIAVEFTAMPGRNFWQRVQQEREFGKKLWDLSMGGATAIAAKNNGFLAPIRPLLLPEIADDSKWIGGLDEAFSDREKEYIFGYTLYVTKTGAVNHDFIKESDLKSSGQILDPKFRGKIALTTPTGGSSYQSLGHLAFMYGGNFIRDLLAKQDVVVTDDNRQQVEWLVRGKYPIAIGFDTSLLASLKKQGLGKNVMILEDKIMRFTNGFGAISLLEGAPHPNAAKVYLNWLLSQKAQIMLSKNVGLNSSRTDVPPVDKETAVDPTKLSKYRNGSSEESGEFNNRLLPLIKEALKK